MKKRALIYLGIIFLAMGIGLTIFYLGKDHTSKMTFEECEKSGGVAWLVDLQHPDICSSCAAFLECQEQNPGAPDLREACPMITSCSECVQENFPYPDICPGGREKLGEIEDAAIWFQCCK